MRLVDLDSNDFENHLETGREEFARGVRFVWDTLNNLPIVEAIPIEWLKRWEEKHKDDPCYCGFVSEEIIKDWEKENERER